jgi:CBS domain-containing protein
MLVQDLMIRDVVTVDRAASLADAARTMLEAGTGSVLVTADSNPTGIVTETDALAAGCAASVPFEDIPVAEVMSQPLESIQPDATVRAAVDRMTEADVKKLPVMDGMELQGIVTMSDVVGSYHEIVREAHELDEQREGWESERLTSGDIAELTRREE